MFAGFLPQAPARCVRGPDGHGHGHRGHLGARVYLDRTPVTITAAGRAAFDTWIAQEPGPALMRFPLVLTVFFGDHLDPALLGRFLRAHHQARLDVYQGMTAEVTDEFPRATLELGIAYERTVITWIDGLPWTQASEGAGKSVKPKRAKATKPCP